MLCHIWLSLMIIIFAKASYPFPISFFGGLVKAINFKGASRSSQRAKF